MIVPKQPSLRATAPCWGCGRDTLLLVLPGVRLMKCRAKGCGAIHPASTAAAVAEFVNETKQLDTYFAHP